MPKVIITGATGYIGSHLANYLLSKGWEIGIIVRSTSKLNNIKKIKHKLNIFVYNGNIQTLIDFFEEFNCDVVMHLAASIINDPTPDLIHDLIFSNIEFGTQILESMKYCGVKLFIGTGSFWQNYDSDYYNPVNLYAATKEAFEKLLKFYVESYNFRAITLRLFDVYGEDDKRPKLLNLIRDVSNDSECLDITEGEQFLDLVHINDVVRAYESSYYLLKENINVRNEIFGVSSGVQKKLKDILFLYQKINNVRLNLNWGGRAYRNREIMTPYNGYKKLPNWDLTIPLETGLKLLKKVK